MSHKPASVAWPAIIAGLLLALVVISITRLYHASKVEPCKSALPAPCPCEPVTPCTCDHAALLNLHQELKVQLESLRTDVTALEDRASDGESKVLMGYQGILERFKNIEARLPKKPAASKPPVRRQASCGAHPPSCEGIAALGADGEPDGVTGVLLCTATPWYPGKCIQEMRLDHAKSMQKRIEKRKLLLQILFGACA